MRYILMVPQVVYVSFIYHCCFFDLLYFDDEQIHTNPATIHKQIGKIKNCTFFLKQTHIFTIYKINVRGKKAKKQGFIKLAGR